MRLGDLLTVELSELRKSKTAGFNPTKIFSFTSGTLPDNASNPTVKELETKDMDNQGATSDVDSEEEAEDLPFN